MRWWCDVLFRPRFADGRSIHDRYVTKDKRIVGRGEPFEARFAGEGDGHSCRSITDLFRVLRERFRFTLAVKVANGYAKFGDFVYRLGEDAVPCPSWTMCAHMHLRVPTLALREATWATFARLKHAEADGGLLWRVPPLRRFLDAVDGAPTPRDAPRPTKRRPRRPKTLDQTFADMVLG